jgi:hypothetical protein
MGWECVDNICTLWLPDVGVMGTMVTMLGLAVAVLFAIMILTAAFRG